MRCCTSRGAAHVRHQVGGLAQGFHSSYIPDIVVDDMQLNRHSAHTRAGRRWATNSFLLLLQVQVIRGALDLTLKTGRHALTPLDEVRPAMRTASSQNVAMTRCL